MNQLLKYSAAILGLAVTIASGGSLSVSNSKGFASNPIVDKSGVVLTGSDSVIVAIGTFASSPNTIAPAEEALAGSVYRGLLAEFTSYGTSVSLLSSAAPLNLQGVFSFQDRARVTGTPLAGKPVYVIVAKGLDLAGASEVAILKTSAVFRSADDDNPLPTLVGVGANLGTMTIVGSDSLHTAVATPLDDTPESAYSLAEVIANGMPPTDLALSQTILAENAPAATLVGGFLVSDADVGDSFTCSLVSGSGDDDNWKFTMSGDQLLSAATFDHEEQSAAAVRVRVVDSFGLGFEKALTVAISDDRSEDFDMDGLTEAEEEDIHGTSDADPDSDGDGFNDGFEIRHGLIPNSNLDGTGDRDGDGWADWLEVRLGTDAEVAGPGLDFAVSFNDQSNPIVRVGPGRPLLGFCVERSTTLSSSWVEVADFPSGLPLGQILEWVDREAPEECAFYRVGAYPLPVPAAE